MGFSFHHQNKKSTKILLCFLVHTFVDTLYMLMNDYELCYDADFMPEIIYIININPIVVSTDISRF